MDTIETTCFAPLATDQVSSIGMPSASHLVLSAQAQFFLPEAVLSTFQGGCVTNIPDPVEVETEYDFFAPRSPELGPPMGQPGNPHEEDPKRIRAQQYAAQAGSFALLLHFIYTHEDMELRDGLSASINQKGMLLNLVALTEMRGGTPLHYAQALNFGELVIQKAGFTSEQYSVYPLTRPKKPMLEHPWQQAQANSIMILPNSPYTWDPKKLDKGKQELLNKELELTGVNVPSCPFAAKVLFEVNEHPTPPM